jgi:flagellar motility protein MotE (MotC chaperone)
MPVRVLPLTLLAVFLMLTVKVGDVWHGFASLTQNIQVTTAQAQAQATQGAGLPGSPAQLAANPGVEPGPGAKPGEPQVATTAPLPTAKLPLDPTRFTQSDIDLLQALRDRSVKLDDREREIDQRSAVLKAAEKRLEEKVADLDAVKLELQQMMARNNEQEDGRLRSLVRIYESMKPKEAAQIFDKLEINVLLGVVERMKENKVAPILASMTPERARQVTDMLADKSQRPPPRQ